MMQIFQLCRHQKACHPNVGLCGGKGSMLSEAVHYDFCCLNRHARFPSGMALV